MKVFLRSAGVVLLLIITGCPNRHEQSHVATAQLPLTAKAVGSDPSIADLLRGRPQPPRNSLLYKDSSASVRSGGAEEGMWATLTERLQEPIAHGTGGCWHVEFWQTGLRPGSPVPLCTRDFKRFIPPGEREQVREKMRQEVERNRKKWPRPAWSPILEDVYALCERANDLVASTHKGFTHLIVATDLGQYSPRFKVPSILGDEEETLERVKREMPELQNPPDKITIIYFPGGLEPETRGNNLPTLTERDRKAVKDFFAAAFRGWGIKDVEFAPVTSFGETGQ